MTVSKTIGPVIGAVLLILSGLSDPALSRVDVNSGVAVPLPPPPLLIPAPPALVLIPGTRVHRTAGSDVDLLFYRGWWYRPYEGRWFRARSCQGAWVFIPPSKVPPALLALPPDYRLIPPGEKKIHHKKLKQRKDKEPPPPKIKKIKTTEDQHQDKPKAKKDKEQKGGLPENQGKNQGSYLKSTNPKSN
jgi:hypothetical protein